MIRLKFFWVSGHLKWLVEGNVSEKRAISIFGAEVKGSPGNGHSTPL
jgi:hypothetical protein